MHVALSGATGFTGRRIVAELLRRGHEVRALVRPSSTRRELPAELARVEGDMADSKALASLLLETDAYVHVASLGFGHADVVVGALEAAGVRRAIFFSSTSLFTRLPAASKGVRQAAEDRVRRMAGNWTILRPTMIYGDAGDRNLSRMIRFVARSPVVPLPGGGQALVQPVHVEDLGRAAVDALASASTACRAYDLPGADAAPLRQLIDHVARELGRRPLVVSLPIRPMAALAEAWFRVGLPPRISAEQVLRLGEDKAFSYDSARRDWGYSPRGWREGLATEVRLLRDSGLL
jgi:nucleoside-diphosphate-sugar epimerase